VTVYNPFHSFINMENEQYFENTREVRMHFTSSTNRRPYSVFPETLRSSPMTMNIFAGLERGLCCIIIVHIVEWE